MEEEPNYHQIHPWDVSRGLGCGLDGALFLGPPIGSTSLLPWRFHRTISDEGLQTFTIQRAQENTWSSRMHSVVLSSICGYQ